jgi:hypothetical protein
MFSSLDRVNDILTTIRRHLEEIKPLVQDGSVVLGGKCPLSPQYIYMCCLP